MKSRKNKNYLLEVPILLYGLKLLIFDRAFIYSKIRLQVY